MITNINYFLINVKQDKNFWNIFKPKERFSQICPPGHIKINTSKYLPYSSFYGTIFFEQYFSFDTVGECFISKITNLGTKMFKQKFQYWLEVEYNFSKDQQMIDCLNKIY